jgi:hypothetical protein
MSRQSAALTTSRIPATPAAIAFHSASAWAFAPSPIPA